MGRPGPLLVRAIRLLKDGEWHREEWLITHLMHSGLVHPGIAHRRAERTRASISSVRHGEVKPRVRERTDEELIRTGARTLIRDAIGTRYIEKKVIDGTRMVRLSPELPKHYLDYDEYGQELPGAAELKRQRERDRRNADAAARRAEDGEVNIRIQKLADLVAANNTPQTEEEEEVPREAPAEPEPEPELIEEPEPEPEPEPPEPELVTPVESGTEVDGQPRKKLHKIDPEAVMLEIAEIVAKEHGLRKQGVYERVRSTRSRNVILRLIDQAVVEGLVVAEDVGLTGRVKKYYPPPPSTAELP